MFKIIYMMIVLVYCISGLALRDFAGDYSSARIKILTTCAKSPGICKLTELHKAVLEGNVEVIRQLVQEGADLNAVAKQNWTAAHFAVLHESRDILDWVYAFGSSDKALDLNQATPEQLWSLTHLSDSHRINMWDEDTQSVKQIDSNEFTRLTGARFIERIKMSPMTLAREWLTGFKVNPQTWGNSKKYQLQDQNSVYIRKMPGHVGYGLYALRDFEPGEVIGEYQGEWIGKLAKGREAEYATQSINGFHLRGYVPFSAHGFPNSALWPAKYLNGVKLNEVLVANQGIQANQPIMWNYLTHDVAWKYYQEQMTDELDRYISKNGLRFTSRALDTHVDIVMYVLTTPSVFLRLLFEDKMSQADLDWILKEKLLARQSESLSTVQRFIEDYLTAISKLSQLNRQNLKGFLASKAREGNVQILFQILANIDSVCSDSRQSGWLSLLGFGSEKTCETNHMELYWFKVWNTFCKQNITPGAGNCEELKKMLPENYEL